MALEDMKSSLGPNDSPTGIGNTARYLLKKINEWWNSESQKNSLVSKGTPDRHEPLK